MDDGGFQFCQTVLIRKVLEATGTDHCNGFPKPTKVEAPLGTDANSSEDKIDLPNLYAYVIRMILYLASSTRTDIYFAVHQCERFTHNTKLSHETSVKRIFQYLQGTHYNGLVFNPSKKLVVDCDFDAYFAGLWGHENPQDTICARSRTVYMVTVFHPGIGIVDLVTPQAFSRPPARHSRPRAPAATLVIGGGFGDRGNPGRALSKPRGSLPNRPRGQGGPHAGEALFPIDPLLSGAAFSGMDPFPDLERVTVVRVDQDGKVNLMHSLFSLRVDLYSD